MRSDSDNLLGLAYLGGVCSQYKYSINEEWGGFTGVVVKCRLNYT